MLAPVSWAIFNNSNYILPTQFPLELQLKQTFFTSSSQKGCFAFNGMEELLCSTPEMVTFHWWLN